MEESSSCGFVRTGWRKRWFSYLALGLRSRRKGSAVLSPSEVAVMLHEMGYTKEAQVYDCFWTGLRWTEPVYGGQNRMAPLRNMFPDLVRPCAPFVFIHWLQGLFPVSSSHCPFNI